MCGCLGYVLEGKDVGWGLLSRRPSSSGPRPGPSINDTEHVSLRSEPVVLAMQHYELSYQGVRHCMSDPDLGRDYVHCLMCMLHPGV
jgi:hypothetical protein